MRSKVIHRRSIAVAGAVAVAGMVTLGACGSHGNAANNADVKAESQQLGIYNATQPLPVFNKSQLRQTLIEIETAQSQPTTTTTFFFNLGSPNPISSCPSIGFPVPTTDEISNPEQITRSSVGSGNYSDGVVPQIDPNGVYSGDSTGTYVLCLNASGTPYASYWEGYVYAVSGAASWDTKTQSISNVTNPTGNFSVLSQSDTRKTGTQTESSAPVPKA